MAQNKYENLGKSRNGGWLLPSGSFHFAGLSRYRVQVFESGEEALHLPPFWLLFITS